MSKYAFITGATSGIGLATAKALAAGGYDLALAARNEGKLSSVKADIEKEFSVKVTPYVLDVREPEEIRKTVAACLAAFGAPDVLVNDAGLARGLEPYAETKEEDILQMIDTNIKGPRGQYDETYDTDSYGIWPRKPTPVEEDTDTPVEKSDNSSDVSIKIS